LPPFLNGFGGLNAGASANIGNDGTYDDPIVDWAFGGTYKGDAFQVMPTVDVLYTTTPNSVQSKDSVIRESRINQGASLKFDTTYNPFNAD
jgi:hypothetical protein